MTQRTLLLIVSLLLAPSLGAASQRATTVADAAVVHISRFVAGVLVKKAIDDYAYPLFANVIGQKIAPHMPDRLSSLKGYMNPSWKISASTTGASFSADSGASVDLARFTALVAAAVVPQWLNKVTGSLAHDGTTGADNRGRIAFCAGMAMKNVVQSAFSR